MGTELEKREPFSVVPTDVASALKLAELISQSELAPKDFRGKPANCLIAMQLGAELGFPPMQSIQNVAVINGRPSIYGDLGKALLRTRGFDIIESESEEIKKSGIAFCTIRHPRQRDVTRSFSKEDAVQAGLWGKAGPWTGYPWRMMAWRAFWFAARDAAPDALKGVRGAEEVEDYDEVGTLATSLVEPRRLSERTTEQTAPPPAEPTKDFSVADAERPTTPTPMPVEPPPTAGREPGDDGDEPVDTQIRCDCPGHPLAVFREGTAKSGKAWSAYMCAKPRNAADNCKFVEWQ